MKENINETNLPSVVIAAVSHYKSKRDIAISELDACLNKATKVEGNVEFTDKVIKLFADLHLAEGILETINSSIKLPKEPFDEVEKP